MATPPRQISLTGIKPTGIPHLGNYVGAIRPAIALTADYDAFYFIADYHALTTIRDPALLDEYTHSVTATWLACGLDPEVVTLYRQSDVPETFELQWVLFGAVFLSVVASTTLLVRHNLPPAAWPAGIAAFTIVFAGGQIVGPVLVGWVADGPGGLVRGLALSAGALALGALLASRQRALPNAPAH